ncbi:MAG TPA: tetratricopeptide repeat protein [Opitutus sp.]|nr:tetratricopeptide repeat protein [Opitutus sp.]
MNKKLLSLVIVLLAAVLGAGGWWVNSAANRRAVVVAALPALPDLASASPALRDHLTAADARARSLLHARAGLAELSRLYQANGFPNEAIQCYGGLEQLEPDEPRWLHRHATILAGYGEIDPAVELWRRVVALAPDYIPARLRLGDAELKSNHLNAAAAAYQAVLHEKPAEPYALLGLARIDLETGRDADAQKKLESIVAQTNYRLGYDLIVSLYERTGQRDRATAIRGQARAFGSYRDPPDPWIDQLLDDCFDPYRLLIAAGIARDGDPARALSLLERAVTLAPNDVGVHFQLGGLYVSQGQLDRAYAEFQRCTELAPDFSDGWVQLSLVETQRGNKPAADRALAAGLEHCPNSPGLHLMWAQNLHAAGRNEAAIAEYMTSIRLRPNEPDAYVQLGQVLIALDRVDEGMEQIRKALDQDPGDPAALSIMAIHAITANQAAEADHWMGLVARQPRISGTQLESLRAAYRQHFGHDWK